MKCLNDALVRRFVRDADNVSDLRVRAQYGRLEGVASVALNSLLFVVKGTLALATGSIAVFADAFHTLSDVGTSIIVILGFRMSAKPGDARHPFGHGRMEAVSALVLSVLLGVAAFEFGRGSFERLLRPRDVTGGYGVVAILTLTIIGKEILARLSRDLGRRIDSKALEAEFWHHRTDSISTVLVVTSLLLRPLGLSYLDGVAGLVVSGIIGWTALLIARGAIDPLIGEAPPPETVAEIERIAVAVPPVTAVHDVTVHRYGELYFISLHVEVPADSPSTYLHTVSEEVEARVAERFPGMTVVHTDPVDRNHPEYAGVEGTVRELVEADPRIASFHDLRLVGAADVFKIVFDIAVDYSVGEAQLDEIRTNLCEGIRSRHTRSRVVVKIEPRFAGPASTGDANAR